MGTPLSPARRMEIDRAKFPAMNPAEILIWKEFLRLHEGDYAMLPGWWLYKRSKDPGIRPTSGDVFDYNVRIGQGRDPGPMFADNIRQQAIMATQFRLDAVGFQGDTPILFEVDRNSGPAHIGQILSYEAIWRNAKISPTDPKMVLVTDDFKENALDLLRESGITLITVPVDFRALSPYAPPTMKQPGT